MKICLIGGDSPHYELGLISGLIELNVHLEVVGGNALKDSPITRFVRFRNLHGKSSPNNPIWLKVFSVFGTYLKLIANALLTDCRLLHIQWPYKLVLLDRTLLNLWYKALGKKIVFTAHNIDAAARDGNQSWANRLSLRFLYRIVDHIIVHTEFMKDELVHKYHIAANKISVIPHGIMSVVPDSKVDRAECRRRLGIELRRRVVLFFGLIAPYKGLEYLVSAIASLNRSERADPIILVIAGRIKECPEYWIRISEAIRQNGLEGNVLTQLRHIPDDSIDVYFNAADVLALPYRSIFQSGVLFLSLRFGLPVIATDVGSFRHDVIDGQTGYICKVDDAEDLAQKIKLYFESDLFRQLPENRSKIRDEYSERYSWSKIAALTRNVYERVLDGTQ